MSKSRSSSNKKKVKLLYLTTQVEPFLHISSIAGWVKQLIQAIDETQEYEIRIIMPKFGIINERTNSLHEVQRLSGINIPVRDEDVSLVVKVSTLRPTRVQAYFLDNEYLFQRKGIFEDEHGNFYPDNHDRLIFMNKSVLSVLEYLQWIPKIIHCIGWSWALFPMYAKRVYKKGTLLSKAKYLYMHDDSQFQNNMNPEVFSDVHEKEKSPTIENFYALAQQYSDYSSLFADQIKTKVDHDANQISDSKQNDTSYFLDLYKKLLTDS
ncbi:MAG: glycogen/starch synthase [Bacteroidota bacterium]